MSDAVKRSKLSNETVVVNMMYDVATSVGEGLIAIPYLIIIFTPGDN